MNVFCKSLYVSVGQKCHKFWLKSFYFILLLMIPRRFLVLLSHILYWCDSSNYRIKNYKFFLAMTNDAPLDFIVFFHIFQHFKQQSEKKNNFFTCDARPRRLWIQTVCFWLISPAGGDNNPPKTGMPSFFFSTETHSVQEAFTGAPYGWSGPS